MCEGRHRLDDSEASYGFPGVEPNCWESGGQGPGDVKDDGTVGEEGQY